MNRFKKTQRLLTCIALIFFCSGTVHVVSGNDNDEIKKYTSNLPFEMPEIKCPRFPEFSVDITEYGAVGDGHFINTEAFAQAIQTCTEAGGGRVNVPAGIWYTGPITLENNVDLHIDKGAVILFSGKFEDYKIIRTSWEGRAEVRCISPINGKDLKNIAITGQGVIDGSGHLWRPVRKYEVTELHWQKLLKLGGGVYDDGSRWWWWPSKEAVHGKKIVAELNKKENVSLEEYAVVREYLRPVLISLIGCKNVLLDGPTFQNSPAWNIHPLMSENIIIRNIYIRNPWYSTNGDGIDLESCKNVVMYDCRFDVGDDAICLKSGRDKYGRDRGMPSENISIADCIVYHGHGGFVIGSEMSGGVRNILIRDCVFMGTDSGLRFKSKRGRGGIVENIFISHILMEDIPTDAIRFNMFYQNKEPRPEDKFVDVSEQDIPSVTEETPRFQKIYINDIVCKKANRAVYLQGLPEMAIKQIELKDVFISSNYGFQCVDADSIKLNRVTIIPEKEPAYSLHNSRNIELQNIEFSDNIKTMIEITGGRTDGIHLKDVDLSQINERIKIGSKVESDAIQLDR
jgi:polygalacturonase